MKWATQHGWIIKGKTLIHTSELSEAEDLRLRNVAKLYQSVDEAKADFISHPAFRESAPENRDLSKLTDLKLVHPTGRRSIE